jgi:phosphoribosyl 1,2-cyclic phosphodiesterase
MKFSALSSGSSGNCFFVSEKDSSVLIDCGISCSRVLESLSYLRQDPQNLKAIFVTHEHIDHTRGVDVLARQLNIPIYATKGTCKNSFLCLNEKLVNEIENDETVKVGGMEIEAFSKSHDAADPISLRIKNGKTISIVTDVGYACKNVCEAVEDSDFLVIESNHDIKMLEQGPYPWFLKKRILGDKGHLSNLHSALCVLEHGKKRMKNIVLAHLSEKNNTPKLAHSTFKNLIKERQDLKPNLFLSLRDLASPLMLV